MAVLPCLDHLRSVGPLACGWTTWFTKYGGPTERKWSNRTQVVQAGRPRHDMRDAVPPCGTRRRGGAGAGGAGTAPPPLHPVRPRRPARRSRRARLPPARPEATRAPSRPAPRPGALDNPSYHTRGARSEPLPEQPSQYRLPEIRPDARRITFLEELAALVLQVGAPGGQGADVAVVRGRLAGWCRRSWPSRSCP